MTSLRVVLLLLTLVGTAWSQLLSLQGVTNLAVLSGIPTTVDVIASNSLTGQISVSVTSGFTYESDYTTIPGVLILTISEQNTGDGGDGGGTTISSASSLAGGSRTLVLSFLLCLLLVCTNIKVSSVRYALFIMICGIAVAYAASSSVTVTITVPSSSLNVNCLVLATNASVGSSTNCSGSGISSCFVASSASSLSSVCACLAKVTTNASITALSIPDLISPTGSGGCNDEFTAQLKANITNLDSTPSCVQVVLDFYTASSLFDFDNVVSFTVPAGFACSNTTSPAIGRRGTESTEGTLTCTGIVPSGLSQISVEYTATACCATGTDPISLASVAQASDTSKLLGSTDAPLTINAGSCDI